MPFSSAYHLPVLRLLSGLALRCCPVLSRQRYRALFALRNKGGEAAVAVLGEAFGASSALLKHEVAYVMGQMQHPASADVLCRVLQVRGLAGSCFCGLGGEHRRGACEMLGLVGQCCAGRCRLGCM